MTIFWIAYCGIAVGMFLVFWIPELILPNRQHHPKDIILEFIKSFGWAALFPITIPITIWVIRRVRSTALQIDNEEESR